ncbi:MAG TPA: site-2 protease family protein [Verrucomicrobiae bacterium]|nr:site-2 protease family protein [Verrucomicrobiae bacterium]
MPTRQGSIRLFKLAGITVFLHWSWFLVAAYEIQTRGHSYSSILWNVLEYLSLFVIVTMHEFGHALACRSVGGTANQIVLWPLGGVAYVDPPPRPGAALWSIAAGPLVNVILFPLLTIGMIAAGAGWEDSHRNAYEFICVVWVINLGLLIFNVLPVYPLDGGQILRSLLWFVLGRARSLMVAVVLGILGVVALAIWAVCWKPMIVQVQGFWLAIMAVFILLNCWRGLQNARVLARLAALPRRDGFACPACHAAPPLGELWKCGKCGTAFDTFLTQATCPNCGTQFEIARCIDCGQLNPISAWSVSAPVPPAIPSA